MKEYMYYHGEKYNTENVRPVVLITDEEHRDSSYGCMLYWENLNCEANECELYKDVDDVWKVRLIT